MYPGHALTCLLMHPGLALTRSLTHTPFAAQGKPVEISDFAPMRVAFEDRDTGFMAIPLVEKYMWQIWWAGE